MRFLFRLVRDIFSKAVLILILPWVILKAIWIALRPVETTEVAPFVPLDPTDALQDAQSAIASGNLYICLSGTVGIYAPGISKEQKELVKDLPQHILAAGCTHPNIQSSIEYAQIFNQEIVRYLSRQ